MTASIAERVAAGAAWLDENRPGWVERIDLETLEMGDPCRCVLGQNFVGDYYEGADLLERTVGWSKYTTADYGFNIFDEEWWAHGNQSFASLTAQWRRLITARRVLTS